MKHATFFSVESLEVKRYSFQFIIFFQNSPLGTATKSGGFPTFVTTLNSFIDIIHSTENKAIKEGTTSVNSH